MNLTGYECVEIRRLWHMSVLEYEFCLKTSGAQTRIYANIRYHEDEQNRLSQSSSNKIKPISART